MENFSIINEQKLKEIVYEAVQECLNDKNMHSLESNNAENEEFYTRQRLCSFLHISYSTLWRIEKSGILKSQKVGRKNLYSMAEVNQQIKSGKLAKYNRK